MVIPEIFMPPNSLSNINFIEHTESLSNINLIEYSEPMAVNNGQIK